MNFRNLHDASKDRLVVEKDNYKHVFPMHNTTFRVCFAPGVKQCRKSGISNASKSKVLTF